MLRTAPARGSRHPSRVRRGAACALALLIGGAVTVACSSDGVKAVVVSKLAIGSWACAPDAEDATEAPFTVRIDDDGTFLVRFDPDTGAGAFSEPEVTGTWAVEHGDLTWAVDLRREDFGDVVVAGFDDLTLDSHDLTLENPGIFSSSDSFDDRANEQDLRVEAHGTDAVTLTLPAGTPWTCDRK